MSQLFSKVLRQALTTFDRKNAAAFKVNFQTLKQLVDQLSPRDLNLDMGLISEECFAMPNKAPCTFVHIFQNADVAMSVFILRGDYTMPLHDHPMMHGILKTLSGSLRVQSFTKATQPNSPNVLTYVKNAKEVQVVAEESRVLNVSSESAVLAPHKNNYHEITALGGVSAFFDILSPPYDSEIPIYGRRRCSFYRKVMNGGFIDNSTAADMTGNELILERVSTPLSYYCDTGGYDPPEFLHDEIFKYDTTTTEKS